MENINHDMIPSLAVYSFARLSNISEVYSSIDEIEFVLWEANTINYSSHL